jgi:AraC family transcriptional regulator, regulatory protein of adaptative response / methylated-DNA-[protein]-cysteine methyltransferase
MNTRYETDDARWEAVQRRDRKADGAFVFAVTTSGVYCRPDCSGRPLRRNVRFYDSRQAAQAAGFRACKRCRPDEARETLAWGVQPCDLGMVLAAVTDKGLALVLLGDHAPSLERDLAARFPKARLVRDAAALAPAMAAVQARLADPAAPFEIALDPRGGPLAQAVWAALRAIPAGETTSYGELARAIGRPGAARAVAQACAANPLAVITPCHRVVRADGGISGYRWGVERKRALLAQEAAA